MRRTRGLLLAATLFVLPLGAPTGDAQDAASGALGPRLQDATIVGRGGTIVIKRLPVDTANGVVYRDITIQLQFDASGALHVDAASKMPRAAVTAAVSAPMPAHDVTVQSITETATPPEIAAVFLPGLYRMDGGGGTVRLVKGPTIGSRFPSWSLIPAFGDLPLSGADWYAGPTRSNPHQQLMRMAKQAGSDYSYGTADGSGSGAFDNGMLIGAVQHGSHLMLVGFHLRGCCTYSDMPTSQISFTRINH